MTRKERAFAIEAGAISAAGVLGAFVVPALLSMHDSIAFLAGGLLFAGWAIWGAYFFYRINREYSK